ncbi:MAG TPA: hypothetical protein VFR17_13090 [Mycobacterium sp.]|nr:hypothetical protein [Mycobacterium sp.]
MAQAEPRYHWCPGEQWSGWMGANWDPYACHDNHYIDLEAHDPANWHGDGAYDPSFPPYPPGGRYPAR